MRKWAVLLAATAGCTSPDRDRPAAAPPRPADVGQADAALAGVRDPAAHDDLAGSWAMRLREQGKQAEAVEVAGRIRDARIRAAVLAEVQAGGGR